MGEIHSTVYKKKHLLEDIQAIAGPYILETGNPIKIGCVNKGWQAMAEAGDTMSGNTCHATCETRSRLYSLMCEIIAEAKRVTDLGGGHILFTTVPDKGV